MADQSTISTNVNSWFTSNEQDIHFNQKQDPSDIDTVCHQTDEAGCRYLSVLQLPWLNMNRNKKLWQKCVTWSPFFRMTWAVPDFIIKVAATSSLPRWMCNQVKAVKSLVTMSSYCCTLLKSFAANVKFILPWKWLTVWLWLHSYSPSVMGCLCASILYDGVSFSVAGERMITLAAVHHVSHLQKPAAYDVLQLRKTYVA